MSSMKTRRNERRTDVFNTTIKAVALVAVTTLLLVGCGDGDDATGSNDTTAAADETPGSGAGGSGDSDTGDTGDAESGEGSGTSDGSGSLVLDGETIQLTTVRCYLEPQEAAAGGGNILFVVQGEGENAQGEAVMIDISRYDDGSTFAGDVVDINIGDVLSDDVVSLSAMAPTGSVNLDGSTASAEGLTADDMETGESRTVEFSIDC